MASSNFQELMDEILYEPPPMQPPPMLPPPMQPPPMQPPPVQPQLVQPQLVQPQQMPPPAPPPAPAKQPRGVKRMPPGQAAAPGAGPRSKVAAGKGKSRPRAGKASKGAPPPPTAAAKKPRKPKAVSDSEDEEEDKPRPPKKGKKKAKPAISSDSEEEEEDGVDMSDVVQVDSDATSDDSSAGEEEEEAKREGKGGASLLTPARALKGLQPGRVVKKVVLKVRGVDGPFGEFKLVVFNCRTADKKSVNVKSWGKKPRHLGLGEGDIVTFSKLKVVKIFNHDFHDSPFPFDLQMRGNSSFEKM